MSVSDLVGEIDDVRRRTRRASSAAAVPLALLGALVALAAPVYARASERSIGNAEGIVTFDELTRTPSFLDRLLGVHAHVTDYRGVGLYWLVAAPVVFGVIGAYYARRSSRTGLSRNGGRVAVAGAGAYAALVLMMLFGGGAVAEHGAALRLADFLNPFLVVAAVVAVLAWVERDVAVLVVGAVFLAGVLLADAAVYSHVTNAGWTGLFSWGWVTFALGAWLLAGAGVVALVRRA